MAPQRSKEDYYCRVIVPEFSPVNLKYKKEAISITPAFLDHDSQSDTIFAVHGLSRAVQEFSKEVVIEVNGAALNSNLSVLPVETSCGSGVHFISVKISDFNALSDTEFEILVPSSNAAFDMQIWYHSVQQ